MGCGQSKINLYPRRNKSGGKGHGSKKSAAGDSKDGEEEETSGTAGSNAESPREGNHTAASERSGQIPKPRPPPAPPHMLGHPVSTEISASQVDFFKILDEKIEKGRDYDSSSETEIEIEQIRVTTLIQSWDAASQTSSQCAIATNSPPTPRSARRLGARGQTPASPPVRRGHHDSNTSLEKEQSKTGSPGKRTPQMVNWKGSSKTQAQPLQLKPGQKFDTDEQRCYSPQLLTQREIHQSYGVSQDYSETSRDSQITYNPTFQSHSPIHSAKNAAGQGVSQPYIAQIVTYPMSQQTVSYQSVAQKYITPTVSTPGYQPSTPQQQQQITTTQQIPQQPPLAQLPSNPIASTQQQIQQRFPGRIQPGQPPVQPSNIYYIAPTPMVQPPLPPDQILTPKQQTALHLQQYVAMKQAQQAMGYQRMLAGQEYLYGQGETGTLGYGRKLYDRTEDTNYSLNFMTLGRQPASQKALLQNQIVRPISPGLMQFQQSQVTTSPGQQLPTTPKPTINPNVFQNTPGCTASLGRNQSLLQYKDMMLSERFGVSVQSTTSQPHMSASQQSTTGQPQMSVSQQSTTGVVSVSRNNMCQSINIVTQKTVGQIVPVGTNQDLVIYQNDSSNVGRLGSTELTTFKDMPKTNSSNVEQISDVSVKSVVPNKSQMQMGSSLLGRHVYYSQVVSSTAPVASDDQNNSQSNATAVVQKLSANSNSFIVNSAGSETKRNSLDGTPKNSVRTLVQNKSSSLEKNGDYL